MIPIQRIPCPGDCGGRVCGADLYPRLWAAMQRQVKAAGGRLPQQGWMVLTVSCACCGTQDMQFRVRYSTVPTIMEVRA